MNALESLERTGAIVRDHIIHESGRHSFFYIDVERLMLHSEERSIICCVVAKRFAKSNVDVIVVPRVEGLVLSELTAMHLTRITKRDISEFYIEKSGNNGSSSLGDGYESLAGKNILILKDMITVGDSTRRIVEMVIAIGGNVIGLGTILNCAEMTSGDIGGIDLEHFLGVRLYGWHKDECPLCKLNTPINRDVGRASDKYLLN